MFVRAANETPLAKIKFRRSRTSSADNKTVVVNINLMLARTHEMSDIVDMGMRFFSMQADFSSSCSLSWSEYKITAYQSLSQIVVIIYWLGFG